MIGKIVSRYRIIDRLGKGGMAEVYLAEDTSLGRRVAIKFPMLESDERDYRARFLREARAVSELRSPHIATIYDYGETDEGRPFLVMEYVRGDNLSDLMMGGKLTVKRVVDIVEAVAAALDEAHARGIVHRDIKPANTMIDERGQVKVLDFGLAKQIKEEEFKNSEPEARTMLALHTRSGALVGTPAYLSPEQAMGGKVDARSDLFAVGGMLYECLTGQPAFAGSSLIEIAANVIHSDPPAPSTINPNLSPQLDAIVLKALAKKPGKRYQSAAELINDLRAVRAFMEGQSSHTLIQPSPVRLTARESTLTNLSLMLRRPRVPLWYILIGAVGVVVMMGVLWRVLRPPAHTPPADARNWYEVGINALRDGAFYQASKALEQAITIDDKYVLAHARLAESLAELDVTDRAKDELLRATTLASDRSLLPKADALYVGAISATLRRDYSSAIEAYAALAKQSSEVEKPAVLIDLGRAYEKNEDVKKAIEVYAEAASRNSHYATAFLRLGILYGRQKDVAKASDSFDKAEAIYQATGNLEGRTEVIYQRGALFNQLGRLDDAKGLLEQALNLARANNIKSQEIKALRQLSSLAADKGEMSRATDYAREAIDLAQKNGMENFGNQALIDLGNAFLIKGDYTEAEKFLVQAFNSAQRNKARNTEARVRVSLANLRLREKNPDDSVQYIQPALAFYQQGGYRSETSSCLALLARANLRKGDYPAAEDAQQRLLKIGQDSNDQSQIALGHSELGSLLAREEKFTGALDHLAQAEAIYTALGIQRSIGYNLVERAWVLGLLGRFSEVAEPLNRATAIADKPGGEIKRLSFEIKLVSAEIDFTQGHFADAKSKAEKLLASIGTDFPETKMNATRVLGLATANAGTATTGKAKCAEAVDLAKQLGDPWELAKAQLSLAETMLLAGDSQGALANALQAQEVFGRLGQRASEWSALAIAAAASAKSGDKAKAQEYAVRANESLRMLEEQLGKDNYNSFLNRPDVQRLQKQVN